MSELPRKANKIAALVAELAGILKCYLRITVSYCGMKFIWLTMMIKFHNLSYFSSLSPEQCCGRIPRSD